jgi:hypothetical protein
MARSFPIGQIAETLGCTEEEARRHLRETGFTMDPSVSNPAERVPRGSIIVLTEKHAGDPIGLALGRLLAETTEWRDEYDELLPPER